MMVRAILSICLMLCLISACANSGQSAPDTASSASVEHNPEISKDRALKLAQTHLALKNWSWGDPESVSEREGKYYVYYKTPERELRLLGARVLIVDKATQVVSAQKRR